jgi:hypothetical protein
MAQKSNLSDMMGDQDIIDLQNFDLAPGEVKEGTGEEEGKEKETAPPPDPTAPSIQDLMAEVAMLKKTFETPSKPEERRVEEPIEIKAPEAEEISKAFKDGDVQRGVELTMQRFTADNFIPALKDLATNFETKTSKTEGDTRVALANSAASTIKDKVMANPATAVIADQIYLKFKGVSPEHILLPGVIDNVIKQTVGELAMKGEWSGDGPPADIPQGGAGGETPGDVSPEMAAIFEKITGHRGVTEDVISMLRKPHQINLGTGEG